MATSPARKKDNTPETPAITTLKKATCKTLAGTATLTYHICIDDSGVIHWKIADNSGGGMFKLVQKGR